MELRVSEVSRGCGPRPLAPRTPNRAKNTAGNDSLVSATSLFLAAQTFSGVEKKLRKASSPYTVERNGVSQPFGLLPVSNPCKPAGNHSERCT